MSASWGRRGSLAPFHKFVYDTSQWNPLSRLRVDSATDDTLAMVFNTVEDVVPWVPLPEVGWEQVQSISFFRQLLFTDKCSWCYFSMVGMALIHSLVQKFVILLNFEVHRYLPHRGVVESGEFLRSFVFLCHLGWGSKC